MTLIVVGLLCLVLGIVLGAWCGISIYDSLHKPIYKAGDTEVTR